MNLTKMTWERGRAKGLSNKEIRANWKTIWNEAYDETMRASKIGIDAIFKDLEETIQRFTKSAQTQAAEEVSLANIRQIVNAAIDRNGYVDTFKELADIYDNGAGEWIQRIVSAIYDHEMAQWSSGLPQYLSRLQSEVASKFGVDADNLALDTSFFQDDDFNVNGAGQPMDVSALKDLIDSGIGLIAD